MFTCNICPRKCSVKREALTEYGEGFCAVGETPLVARAALHHWEEPPISGTKGSGTIFFCGCNLQCVFCQNHEISRGKNGKLVTVEELKQIYRKLVEQGAHNINLVTGTHFINAISQSLDEPLPVPVVYNTSGYESPEALKLLKNKVQIYLPDLKYADDSLAARLSKAPDYFSIATKAILEMFDQVGRYDIGDDGIMKKGVIIRHLILPGYLENTKKVIDWVKGNFKDGDVIFSLMSQYTPTNLCEDDNLNRCLTREEYDEIEDYLFDSGIEDGFIQELSSASEDYIPPFDLTGV